MFSLRRVSFAPKEMRQKKPNIQSLLVRLKTAPYYYAKQKERKVHIQNKQIKKL